jgi:hypothetical protein
MDGQVKSVIFQQKFQNLLNFSNDIYYWISNVKDANIKLLR